MPRLPFSILTLTFSLLAGCSSTHHAFNNKNAYHISKKLRDYEKITSHSWPTLSINKTILAGKSSPQIPVIRQRLITLGDYNGSHNSEQTLDYRLQNAVKHFQWRHGLSITGNINQKTIAALNVSPRQRLSQLRTSMNKWEKLPSDIGNHYIRVNVPSFDLNIIKDGEKVLNMRVIAGKPSRPSPELYSKVETIAFNPKWNIPTKITKKDIIPKVLKDPEYLAKNNIQIYTDWRRGSPTIYPEEINWESAAKEKDLHFRLSQKPGNNNALGKVKFIFLNKEDVYMHDTPQKNLFDKIQRAFSSGCIRVEEPFRLAEYFLQEQPEYDQQTVNEILANNKTKYVRMKNPVPIYITYITAWVDSEGRSHFREDIYKKDTTSEPHTPAST